jgi:hypothetical protein
MMLDKSNPSLKSFDGILKDIKNSHNITLELDVENKITELGVISSFVISNPEVKDSAFSFKKLFTPVEIAIDADEHEDEFINAFFQFLIKEGILSLYSKNISNFN